MSITVYPTLDIIFEINQQNWIALLDDESYLSFQNKNTVNKWNDNFHMRFLWLLSLFISLFVWTH